MHQFCVIDPTPYTKKLGLPKEWLFCHQNKFNKNKNNFNKKGKKFAADSFDKILSKMGHSLLTSCKLNLSFSVTQKCMYYLAL